MLIPPNLSNWFISFKLLIRMSGSQILSRRCSRTLILLIEMLLLVSFQERRKSFHICLMYSINSHSYEGSEDSDDARMARL